MVNINGYYMVNDGLPTNQVVYPLVNIQKAIEHGH
jgi:hypothetical protein